MITLRQEHMAAFVRFREQKFIKDALDHLKKNFPGQTASYCDWILEEKITDGINIARGYQLKSERGVISFLNLWCQLGLRLDKDGEHGWAHKCLTDPDITDTSQRIQRLADEFRNRMKVE